MVRNIKLLGFYQYSSSDCFNYSFSEEKMSNTQKLGKVVSELKKFGEMPSDAQFLERDEILGLFEEMLTFGIDKQNFSEALEGVVVFPEMLYLLWVTNPPKEKNE